MNETLTIHTAGDLMNVHPQTVLDLIANGTLPAGKIGRAYILLKKDVLAHIERVIVKQTSERLGISRSSQLIRQIRPAQVRVA